MALEPAVSGETGPAEAGPRILYAIVLTPGRKMGSSEDQMVHLSHALRREQGEFVALFCTREADARLDDFIERDVACECLDLFDFDRVRLGRLVAIIDKHRIEAVHWNMFDPLRNRYVWALSLLRPRVRHLFTDHISRLGSPQPVPSMLRRQLAAALWKRYSSVHCVSDFVRDELVARTGVGNAATVLHFIDTSRFAPDAPRRAAKRGELGLGDEFAVLFVGFLRAEKGVDVLLRAFARLPDGARLLIAGDGPDEVALRTLASELGIAGRVTFLGHQRHTEPLYQAADVLACPSLWKEAAGFVNLEAQACGLPVVASRIGGIPEYVLDGSTGLLCTPGDDADLAAKLGLVMVDRELRGRLAGQAEAHAKRQFSPARGTRDLLAWYRAALPQRGAAAGQVRDGKRPAAGPGAAQVK